MLRMASEQKYASRFSSAMRSCKAVTPAGVSTAMALYIKDETLGDPPPAIILMLGLMTPCVSSDGGGNAGAAHAKGMRRAINECMVEIMLER
jgi:hypothetical protein